MSRHSSRSPSIARADCSNRSADRLRLDFPSAAWSRMAANVCAVDRDLSALAPKSPWKRMPKMAVPTAGKPADIKVAHRQRDLAELLRSSLVRVSAMHDPQAIVGMDALRGTILAMSADLARPVFWLVPG